MENTLRGCPNPAKKALEIGTLGTWNGKYLGLLLIGFQIEQIPGNLTLTVNFGSGRMCQNMSQSSSPCAAKPNGPDGTRFTPTDWRWECCFIRWRPTGVWVHRDDIGLMGWNMYVDAVGIARGRATRYRDGPTRRLIGRKTGLKTGLW